MTFQLNAQVKTKMHSRLVQQTRNSNLNGTRYESLSHSQKALFVQQDRAGLFSSTDQIVPDILVAIESEYPPCEIFTSTDSVLAKISAVLMPTRLLMGMTAGDFLL